MNDDDVDHLGEYMLCVRYIECIRLRYSDGCVRGVLTIDSSVDQQLTDSDLEKVLGYVTVLENIEWTANDKRPSQPER